MKRVLQGKKETKHVILSINPDEGVKCIDTSVEPAKAPRSIADCKELTSPRC